MLVKLFSVCAMVPISLLFWGVTEFQDTYHGSLYFTSFLFFSLWILILLVREKHRKTLYRFLLIKINSGRQITYRDKNSERENNKTKISGRQKYWLYWKMGLKIWSLHYYSRTIQRKWLDPGMTTAFYSRPNSTNYCHFKFKIQVSHSEKLLLGGPKNTLFIHTTWTSANNYPQ